MKVATNKGQVIKSKKNFEHVMSISKYYNQISILSTIQISLSDSSFKLSPSRNIFKYEMTHLSPRKSSTTLKTLILKLVYCFLFHIFCFFSCRLAVLNPIHFTIHKKPARRCICFYNTVPMIKKYRLNLLKAILVV